MFDAIDCVSRSRDFARLSVSGYHCIGVMALLLGVLVQIRRKFSETARKSENSVSANRDVKFVYDSELN